MLPPVVLDNGTGSIKSGCAGVSPLPLVVCPTVTGRLREVDTLLPTLLHASSAFKGIRRDVAQDANTADALLRAESPQHRVLRGDELDGLRGSVERTYPIKNGVIHNMEAMEELWDYVLCHRLPQLCHSTSKRRSCLFNAEHEKCDECAAETDSGQAWLDGRQLFLTEPPNLSVKQRCDTMEIFFETYRFASIQSTPQGVLSLFANGTECGVAVECGESLTHCTPVFDGCVLTTAQRRVDLGGQAVTDHLLRLLRDKQQGFREGGGIVKSAMHAGVCNGTGADVFRRLKERYCFVSVHHDLDQRLACETSALHRTCVLPDGAKLRLGEERFAAPEVLFAPSLMNVECPGIAEVVWDCIEATDIDVRRSLYENILLSGGTTLLPGFGARLVKELRGFYRRDKVKEDEGRMARCPIRVKEPPRRQYMAYMGGALMAELSAGQSELWMSREAYEEGGAAAVVSRLHGAS